MKNFNNFFGFFQGKQKSSCPSVDCDGVTYKTIL